MTVKRFDRIALLLGTAYTLGLLLFAAFAFTIRAYAQTPTPTPTATPTVAPTPTLTPTPGPTPVFGDPTLSTVVWGCLVYPTGAPVCTWGDYFEFYGEATAAGSGATTYWPGASGQSASYIIVPNANTKAITATCSLLVDSQSIDAGVGSASAAAWASVDSALSAFDLYVEGAAVSDAEYTVSSTGNDADELLVTVDVVWRLKSGVASWPGDSSFDYNYSNKGNFARIEGRAQAASTGSTNLGIASVRGACEINAVERLSDGSTYVPSTPTVGDAPTPTPCPPSVPGCWQNPEWTDHQWVTIPPQNGWFELEPGSEVCYEIVPAWGEGFRAYNIFNSLWYTVPLGIGDGYEVCATEYDFDLQLFDFSVGTYVAGWFSVLAIFVAYRTIRRS